MSHLTTRSGFILALSLGVLLLIPLWVALGVFSGGGGEEGHADGHGGHNPTDTAEAQRAFIQKTQAFIARHTRADGCVAPDGGAEEHEHSHEAGTDKPEEETEEEGEHAEGHPVVYIRALQFAYLPQKLCLKTGVTYLFKMMSTDVTHGASIQLGPAGMMVRLPPGALVEQEVTFTEPGEYLLYCTYYCGVGHQHMKGQIIVEPAEGSSSPGLNEENVAGEEKGGGYHHED